MMKEVLAVRSFGSHPQSTTLLVRIAARNTIDVHRAWFFCTLCFTTVQSCLQCDGILPVAKLPNADPMRTSVAFTLEKATENPSELASCCSCGLRLKLEGAFPELQ